MNKTAIILLLALSTSAAAWQSTDGQQHGYQSYGAPAIIAPNGRYLGNLSANPYAPNSVSNPYGRYGNPYSADSIKNPYGVYGSPYSNQSPYNPYAR